MNRPTRRTQPHALRLAALPAALALAMAALPATAQDAPRTCPTADDPAAPCADAVELDRVEVRGLRGSLVDALTIKQGSMQIVDAIVAEDIGKFPDNNLVEALQRVTGVQTTDLGDGEPTTVSIRCLKDVNTTNNGRNIFTASGRSVALADVPASLLASVEVFKTRSAAHIETGIAGTLDIRTHRPFDFDGRRFVVAARAIHQEQNNETDPNVSLLASNTWDVGGGRFGALVNVSYAETNYRDQSVTAGAMVPFFTDNPPEGFVPYERIPTIIDGADVWQPGLEPACPSRRAPRSRCAANSTSTCFRATRCSPATSPASASAPPPASRCSGPWTTPREYVFEAFYNGCQRIVQLAAVLVRRLVGRPGRQPRPEHRAVPGHQHRACPPRHRFPVQLHQRRPVHRADRQPSSRLGGRAGTWANG